LIGLSASTVNGSSTSNTMTNNRIVPLNFIVSHSFLLLMI